MKQNIKGKFYTYVSAVWCLIFHSETYYYYSTVSWLNCAKLRIKIARINLILFISFKGNGGMLLDKKWYDDTMVLQFNFVKLY